MVVTSQVSAKWSAFELFLNVMGGCKISNLQFDPELLFNLQSFFSKNLEFFMMFLFAQKDFLIIYVQRKKAFTSGFKMIVKYEVIDPRTKYLPEKADWSFGFRHWHVPGSALIDLPSTFHTCYSISFYSLVFNSLTWRRIRKRVGTVSLIVLFLKIETIQVVLHDCDGV